MVYAGALCSYFIVLKLLCNGVLKGTLQRNKSKAIDMQFFWLIDRAKRGQFTIYYWAQGETNLAHFFTKHHLGSHHRRVRPIHNNITLINKFARVYLIPGLHKWRSWPTQIQTNNSRLPATSWANAHKYWLTALVPTALWRAVKKYGPTGRRITDAREEQKRSRYEQSTLRIKDSVWTLF